MYQTDLQLLENYFLARRFLVFTLAVSCNFFQFVYFIKSLHLSSKFTDKINREILKAFYLKWNYLWSNNSHFFFVYFFSFFLFVLNPAGFLKHYSPLTLTAVSSWGTTTILNTRILETNCKVVIQYSNTSLFINFNISSASQQKKFFLVHLRSNIKNNLVVPMQVDKQSLVGGKLSRTS